MAPISGYGGTRHCADDAYHPDDGAADARRPIVRAAPTARTTTTGATRTTDRGRPAAANEAAPGYGEPYHPPGDLRRAAGDGPPPRDDGYSQNEIIDAGHRFFGSVSKGLASVVEYAFQQVRPPQRLHPGRGRRRRLRRRPALRRGHALYEGCRRPQGVTGRGRRSATTSAARAPRPWFWSTTCAIPSQIYERYAGVQGSAYFVGGVGIQYQTHGNVTLAPIRVGHRPAARCQRRIFEVYPLSNVEPVLSRRAAGIEGRAGDARGGSIAQIAR